MTAVIKLFVFLSALTTCLCFAATEFEGDVPAEIVEQMVSGTIYSDLPDNFPDIQIPDAVMLRGSVVNDFSTQVIFTAISTPEVGARALADSFRAEGWVLLPSPEYEPPQNGFISPDQQQLPFNNDNNYCHDSYGTLTITPEAGNPPGGNLNVRLSQSALRQPGFSCRQQIEQREMSDSRRNMRQFSQPNREYLPRLVLPEESARARPSSFFGGGFSSSGGEIEIEASWAGDMEIAVLNSHFAEQLEEQGWQLDVTWNGELSAGGNWTYNATPDLNFIGTLSIVKRNEEMFDLKFRLMPLGGNATGTSFGIQGIRRIVAP